jgi:hypothetical protein
MDVKKVHAYQQGKEREKALSGQESRKNGLVYPSKRSAKDRPLKP